MIITDVIIHRLVSPVTRRYRNCVSEWIEARPAILVEVLTDNGLTGWGEPVAEPSRVSIEAHVIGRSPFDYEVIYDRLSEKESPASACGIEMALWDLMGKHLEMPVWQLLGGANRDRVPAYASGFFNREGLDHVADVVDEVKRCVDEGFGAVKLRTGFGRDLDEQIVSGTRETIGQDGGLAIDVNTGYDIDTAIEVGKALVDYDLLWYEEPIAGDDADNYLKVKNSLPMRISGAEILCGLKSFREIIQRKALDIIQPDISRAGGFTEGRRISALAAANDVRVLPHMFGSVVRLAATLQWIATLPEPSPDDSLPVYLELDVMENRLRTDLAHTSFELEDGQMPIPDRPGLGVEIDRTALERFATN